MGGQAIDKFGPVEYTREQTNIAVQLNVLPSDLESERSYDVEIVIETAFLTSSVRKTFGNCHSLWLYRTAFMSVIGFY